MKIIRNEPLAKYTTFKIGGPARYFVAVKTKEKLVEALNYAFQNKLEYFILGGGANVLFSDDGFDGVVIKNETNRINYESRKDEILVEAESGASMNLLVNDCVEKGYAGLEYFAGHPGTVGGSVFINAHTRNEEGDLILLGERVVSAEIFEIKTRKIVNVNQSYFCFAYDYSQLKKTHDVLLTAVFKLEAGCIDVLKHRYKWILDYRKKTQDYGGSSAGCTFQNTSAGPAGKLIDECSLKGIQFGGAKISEKHANFIVNVGGAKASDVLHLINLCKRKVKEKFGVELREEIVII